MLVFPQLSSGALSQFPVRKQIRSRTVVNRAADGSCIRLADPAAAVTEWELSYTDLTDTEVSTLEQFFAAVEGRLNGFTFLDPVGNLFASSDRLEAAVWERDPLLSRAGGFADPRGGELAWHLTNTGGGPQGLSQTLAAPDGYRYCISAYVKAALPSRVTLMAGSLREDRGVSADWSRIAFTVSPDAPRFGIEIPASSELDLFGMQVEVQPWPSAYQPTTRGGVYEGARLKDDLLRVTATGFNRHSCKVNIIHANHL